MTTFARRAVSRFAGLAAAVTTVLLVGCPNAGACASSAQEDGASASSSREDLLRPRPGPSVPDLFHPDFDPSSESLPEPRRGGRVTVHLSAKPKHLNYMTENSATTRRILFEVHEFLLQRDWEQWEYRPVLAKELVVEDSVLMKAPHPEAHTLPDGSHRLYGKVTEDGDAWVVEPISAQHGLAETVRIPKADVDKVYRETVFTFDLRDDVKWHDGQAFDADDVRFSYECYKNPTVDCDSVRFQFDKLLDCQLLGPHRVRFFYEKQYFLARDVFSSLTILPSHVFNPHDPSHPEHDPKMSPQDLGRYVNEHPANSMWIGLGPYRVTQFSEEAIIAERTENYFDQAHAGYVDEIRWRHIADDDAAVQALVNGQLDYFARLKPEQYKGNPVNTPEFQQHYYAGYHPQPYMGYTAWNTRRPILADKTVRNALNLAFDWEEYIRTVQLNLGERITGTAYRWGEYYDEGVEPVPFDLAQAEELLAEAGWYDRDGDGLVDKDGVPLRLTFLMPTGNKASEIFATKYQENLERLGVRLDVETREWATFIEDLRNHDFDCANLAWILTLESDPEQIWHSKWREAKGSNHSGHADPETDRLIDAIQVEMDDAKRTTLFHELQARIYGEHPYMFGLHVPIKFAMSKRIRNFQIFAPDPCYSIRRWYVVE